MNEISDRLVANDRESYGDNFQAHSLEMYKLYVQMADNISARRQSANSFFLTVNTALIAIVGYMSGENVEINWVVNLAGMVLCYSWYRLIRSYKDLNSGKFKVVHEIEKTLPLAPYDAEWEALGRGNDSKLYLPFTVIEMRVPWIFLVLHLVALALSVYRVVYG